MCHAADNDTSSADGMYIGTTTGNSTKFVPDQYLGGVTSALQCNGVGLVTSLLSIACDSCCSAMGTLCASNT